MEELLVYVAKALVNDPDSVKVENAGEENGVVTYKLSVAKDDMGRIIGRQGRIAKAIRSIMKSAAVKQGVKVNVDIID